MTRLEAQRAAMVVAIQEADPSCTKIYDHWIHPMDSSPERMYELFGRQDDVDPEKQIMHMWHFSRRDGQRNITELQAWGAQGGVLKNINRKREVWDIECWKTVQDPVNSSLVTTPSEYAFQQAADDVQLHLAMNTEIIALMRDPYKIIVEDVSIIDLSTRWLSNTFHCHYANLTMTMSYLYQN